ncbi:hypothetical protein [Spiroplasma endosymbiont of Polydrusus formosus]
MVINKMYNCCYNMGCGDDNVTYNEDNTGLKLAHNQNYSDIVQILSE